MCVGIVLQGFDFEDKVDKKLNGLDHQYRGTANLDSPLSKIPPTSLVLINVNLKPYVTKQQRSGYITKD